MRKRLQRVQFKRKRKGKTNYKKRLSLLKSNKLRLVVRKTSNNIIVQVIEYHPEGDKILVSAHSKELIKNFGWKAHTQNMPTAYLTGLLCGIKSKNKNINEVILDISPYTSIKGSLIYAALKGVLDSDIKIAHSPKVLPTENRLKGQHIADYAKLIKDTPTYQKQFSRYLKKNLEPEQLPKHFEEIKNQILTKLKGS